MPGPSTIGSLWRVLVLHNFVVLSALHDTTMLPSGEIAPAHTSPTWPRSRTRGLNVAASQTRIVRSVLVVTNDLPSAANAMAVTQPVWSRSVATTFRAAKSQTTISPVQCPTMSCLPSPENATDMGGRPAPNPAYRMGGNSSRPGNRHTRRWSAVSYTHLTLPTS